MKSREATMKVLFFCRKMPDLCGAFLHDIDFATELQRRGHQVAFLTILKPDEGYNGGVFRGFRFMHYTAAGPLLDTADLLVTPHSPILPDVRKINSRAYNRPLVATCHFDGNYTAITGNSSTAWSEMLLFVNSVMEANYRKNIAPWPAQIERTGLVRPILNRDAITISEPFQGDCITLINANQNKGQNVFLELARRMPDRKFLGVLPYYGERHVAQSPGNVEWIPFSDDIRDILRRTRILLVPSYYESFGRVAVEAMLNGIPVLYSKPAKNSPYPGGSTEGLQSWIEPAGIACDRDAPADWVEVLRALEDPDTYAAKREEVQAHIEAQDFFSEGPRIASLIEGFAKAHPVVVKVVAREETAKRPAEPGRFVQPAVGRPVGVGFSSGRLNIRR